MEKRFFFSKSGTRSRRHLCILKWVVYMSPGEREGECNYTYERQSACIHTVCVYAGARMHVRVYCSLGNVSFRCLIVCTLSDKQHVTLNSWHSLGSIGPICIGFKTSPNVACQQELRQNISPWVILHVILISAWIWSRFNKVKAFIIRLNVFTNMGKVQLDQFSTVFCQRRKDTDLLLWKWSITAFKKVNWRNRFHEQPRCDYCMNSNTTLQLKTPWAPSEAVTADIHNFVSHYFYYQHQHSY